jgi:hypothetical protein
MRFRFISLIALAALLIVVGVLLLSPFWLPVAAAYAAKDYGVGWDAAKADGYTSITLTGAHYRKTNLAIELDRVVVPQPLLWVNGYLITGIPPEVEIGELKIVISETAAEDDSGASPIDLVTKIEGIIREILPYAPSIHVGKIDLVIESSGFEMSLRDARLKDNALAGTLAGIGVLPEVELRLYLDENRVRLVARNAAGGDDFYLRSSLRSDAIVPEFEAEVNASLEQIIGAEESGSFVAMKLSGGREGLSIAEFNVSSSWIAGSLSDPIEFNYRTKSFSGSARMELEADLTRQSLVDAQGILKAQVDILDPGAADIDLRFAVTGQDLLLKGIPVLSMHCSGTLAYPLVEIAESEFQLDESSVVEISGSGNIEEREGEGRLVYSLSPDWLKTLGLPIQLTDVLSGELDFAGPLAALKHKGRVNSVPVIVEGLPLLTTRLSWEGTGLDTVSVEGEVASDKDGLMDLEFRVEKSATEGEVVINVDRGTVSSFDLPPYELKSPVVVLLQAGGTGRLKSISPVRLESSSGSLSGHYNLDTGTGGIAGMNLELAVFEAWISQDLPAIIIDDFEMSVDAIFPQLLATFDASLHGTDALVDALSLHVLGKADQSGIELLLLEGKVDGYPFCSGSGKFPLVIHPMRAGNTRLFDFVENGSLAGSLTVDLSPQLVQDFSQIPFLDLIQGARLDVVLEGTIEEPEASLEMDLQQLNVLGLVDPRLEGFIFEDIQLVLDLTPELLEIESFKAEIMKGHLEIGGFVSTDFLRNEIREGKLNWKSLLEVANLDATLRGFKASEFQAYLPGYLRPRGSLNGSVQLKPGFDVSGDLQLEGFSLRPTLYSQTVEQIRLGLKIKDTRFDLYDASALLGDSLVNVGGYFDFNDFHNPLFSIQLTGTRTPLVRTTDLLLLADLDLSLDQTDSNKPATLSGTMNLRDGVLLMDVDPLGAKTSGGALPKPPFFSIEVNPFSEWNLDINLTGEEAVRFRSQFVDALLSIRADLSGTLENPVWIGEVRTSEGNIAFPSTRLSVSNGQFFITREQPDTIQLDINAIGQTASYVVSMRIAGTVDDPQVLFESTPALSNAQIFQLLATGSLEGSGMGSFGLYLGRGMFGPGGGDGLLSRISVEMGRDISDTGQSTIDLFYDLSDRFRLHGEYDKYDAQNLDLEWEVFSR